MELTYITGEPGVGKSTLMEHLTRDLNYHEVNGPVPHTVYEAGVTELGKRREAFPGSDAYPMDIQPKVLRFLSTYKPELVIVEGDRLANMKFFDWVRGVLGYNVVCYNLWGAAVALDRRASRGHGFDETWLRGRQSKVEKLVQNLEVNRYCVQALDATQSLEELEARMADPVVQALAAARG